MSVLRNLTWDQARYYADGGDGTRRRIRRAAWGGKDKRGQGIDVWLRRPNFLWFVDVANAWSARVVQSYDFDEREFYAKDWEADFPETNTPPTNPPTQPPPFESGNNGGTGGNANDCQTCAEINRAARAVGDPHFVIRDEQGRMTAFWDDNYVGAAGKRTLFFRSGQVEVWYATQEGGPPGGMVVNKLWFVEGENETLFEVQAEGCVRIANDTVTPMTEPFNRTAPLVTGGDYVLAVFPRGFFFEFNVDFANATRCQARECGGALGWCYWRLSFDQQPLLPPFGVGAGPYVDGTSWLGARMGLTRSRIEYPDTGPMYAFSPRLWGNICRIQPIEVPTVLIEWDGLTWTEWTPSADTICEGETFSQTRTNTATSEEQEQLAVGTKHCWTQWTPDASDYCQGATFTQTRTNTEDPAITQERQAEGTMPAQWSEWYPVGPMEDEICEGVSFEQTVYRHDENWQCGEQYEVRQAVGTKQSGEWRIIETADGVVYASGYGAPPATWTPPRYSYTGYMELQEFTCNGDSSGTWSTVKQWTTINGGPTVALP
jgi:hypothetical protein